MPPAAASLSELRGQPLSLGLDLGTSSLKVVLRARSGRWWLLHDGPAPPSPDPAAALDVLRAALAGCGVPGIGAQVTRVACTAHGQSALVVDRTTLELVGAPIWWHDAAPPPGPCPLGDGAVLPPAGSWQPARLRQWRERHGEAARGRRLVALQLKDLLNLRLTGRAASDARSMRGWVDAAGAVPAAVEAHVGLGPGLLPPLLPPDAALGPVSTAGAARSGLPEGTCQVVVGCDDLSAGVLGLWPLVPGQAFNLAGSSEHLGVVLAPGGPDTAAARAARAHAAASGLSYLPACGRLPPLLYSATSTGAASLKAAGFPAAAWAALARAEPPARAALDALPAFDASVSGQRGLRPDGAHAVAHGGWGSAEAAAAAAALPEPLRGWRLLDGLNAALAPVAAALAASGFRDAALPVRLGGGLAASAALVRQRAAAAWAGEAGVAARAGSEVGALGAARLACAPRRAVVFGAGKVGRGFLCQLLHRGGWHVTLVDSHAPAVAALNAHGGRWTVHNLGTGEREEVAAEGGALHLEADAAAVEAAVLRADLLLTCMGANNLEPWAEGLQAAICRRLGRGELDLVLGENHPRPAAAVREALRRAAGTEAERALLDAKLGVAQAQILRSCIEPTAEQHPLTVQVQDHWTLPLDGAALKTDLDLWGAKPTADFERELTRKLFTYNCVNALVCYLGALWGYEWLADAANDPAIARVAMAAGAESSAALVAEYGFDPAGQRDFCERAMAKYRDAAIRDPIERNARDPVRKLSRYDRLLGPTYLCRKHGLPCGQLAVGVAAALRYPGARMAPDGELDGLLAAGDAELDELLRGADR